MKTALAIAMIAFPLAAGPNDFPLARPAVSFEVAETAGQAAAIVWDGRWQGTTVTGQQIVLDLRVKGQRLTGRLIVGKQSADITAGKISGQAFALETGKIDGYAVAGTGRYLGDAIEFSIDGVKEPVTLTRVK